MTTETKFKDEMGENPLGNREDLKVLGDYILELYTDTIGGRCNINVWMVSDDPDHWRDYKDRGTVWFDNRHDARKEFENLTPGTDIERFLEENSE